MYYIYWFGLIQFSFILEILIRELNQTTSLFNWFNSIFYLNHKNHFFYWFESSAQLNFFIRLRLRISIMQLLWRYLQERGKHTQTCNTVLNMYLWFEITIFWTFFFIKMLVICHVNPSNVLIGNYEEWKQESSNTLARRIFPYRTKSCTKSNHN
jgi:hypothetical protein